MKPRNMVYHIVNPPYGEALMDGRCSAPWVRGRTPGEKRRGRSATFFLASSVLASSACDKADKDDTRPCEALAWSKAPTPTESAAFCTDAYVRLCTRAFGDCGTSWPDTVALAEYRSEAACQTQAPVDFCDRDYSLAETALDPAASTRCTATIDTGECSIFDGPIPACRDVLTLVPPADADCASVGPGSYDVELNPTLSAYAGGPYKAFCTCLEAGDSLAVVAENRELSIRDPALFVFGPNGQPLASAG